MITAGKWINLNFHPLPVTNINFSTATNSSHSVVYPGLLLPCFTFRSYSKLITAVLHYGYAIKFIFIDLCVLPHRTRLDINAYFIRLSKSTSLISFDRQTGYSLYGEIINFNPVRSHLAHWICFVTFRTDKPH